MPRGGVVTGDEATLKDLALRGREAGDGGKQRGDRGEMCDVSHLARFSISLGRAR